jgi:hypothetical protein
MADRIRPSVVPLCFFSFFFFFLSRWERTRRLTMKESIGSVRIISNIYIGLSFFPSIGKPSPGADCPPNNSFVFLFLYWLPMSFFCFCFCVFGSTFRHDFAIHLVTHPLRVGKLFGSLDTYLTPHVTVPVRRRLAVCLVWLAWSVARATTSLGALPLPSVFRQLSSWIIRGRSVVIVSALNSRRIRLFSFFSFFLGCCWCTVVCFQVIYLRLAGAQFSCLVSRNFVRI